MNKLEQTDPRINLILEEFLERDAQDKPVILRRAVKSQDAVPAATKGLASSGTSRTVETEFGRKVVLKDTAGRSFNDDPANGQNAQENHDFEPFVSTSGVFGFSKVEQFKQILDRKKDYAI